MLPWITIGSSFPPVEQALVEPNGLLAAGDDLTPERLLDAYRHGIFPWYEAGQPVLWWSPDPRMVLPVEAFRLRRSLAKVVRNGGFEIRVDTAFAAVMQCCARVARPGQDGTWITPGIVAAYSGLHRRGHAHSIEAWREGRLVGGLYGVSIGRMFFGESMFALERDASKVALAHLVAMLRARGFPLIDCQQETEHLASVGARPIPRAVFAERVARLVDSGAPRDPWEPPAVEDVLA
ncbi:MAG: leucyl/phenylalanyl-tRNA--protein transferase [Betaproteobacteria bacterium]|jgi:leucyl/phenylalanyl-tRNA--protein transferase|nr:leucyl/phenylalanyl-tRNA--protein transferase [Betaproteobacteria bacterium]MBK7590540.1 leucyl/phenylalanyl-tRNA--protein transferase [Betaproteobacteria bacterium]MBK7745588.1 leucyl/phenylalanyl-tRNA--protein transferase [Betaproteobacteria bacterium]MBK8689737.1 leucyl/phenylalanyl-tRNA--protein transferase [Betaproteobacteria bacterium]